jgi:hypothetical protein
MVAEVTAVRDRAAAATEGVTAARGPLRAAADTEGVTAARGLLRAAADTAGVTAARDPLRAGVEMAGPVPPRAITEAADVRLRAAGGSTPPEATTARIADVRKWKQYSGRFPKPPFFISLGTLKFPWEFPLRIGIANVQIRIERE